MERSTNPSVPDNSTHHTLSLCGCSRPSAQADPRTGYLCGNDSRWIIRPLLVASQRWSTPSSSVSLPPSSCLEYQVLFTLVVSLFFLCRPALIIVQLCLPLFSSLSSDICLWMCTSVGRVRETQTQHVGTDPSGKWQHRTTEKARWLPVSVGSGCYLHVWIFYSRTGVTADFTCWITGNSNQEHIKAVMLKL